MSEKIRSYLDGSLLLYRPDPPLSKFIHHIWLARSSCSEVKSEARFLPNASIDLVINLADEPEKVWDIHSMDYQVLRQSWVNGLQTKFMKIQSPHYLHMIGVEFKPGGAFPFFGFSMSELTDSSVELDLIWAKAAAETRDALLEAKSTEEQFSIFERLLRNQLTTRNDLHSVINCAIKMISMSSASQRIPIVASNLGIDYKRFIGLFERVVGITPKLFARICRFQKAVHAIHENRNEPLANVAVDFDYFDQAHFIKEFEEFSGLSPNEYRNKKGTIPNFISQA